MPRRRGASRWRLGASSPQWRIHCFFDNWVGRLAGSEEFENGTLAIISLNAIWIGFESDTAEHDSLKDAPLGYVLVENFFCVYFLIELILRFFGSVSKMRLMKDRWFEFDSVLVIMMVTETWFLPYGLGYGGLGPFGLLRLLRLLRLTRMVRLMRAMPELAVLVKGMVVAARGVGSTLVLLMGFLYAFSIIFVQQFKSNEWCGDGEYSGGACAGGEFDGESPPLRAAFGTVPQAMLTLFVQGTLLDDATPLITQLRDGLYGMLYIYLLFVVVSSFTVFNMLIGVLCDQVSATATSEAEKMMVERVHEQIKAALETLKMDGKKISREDFTKLRQSEEAESALQTLGVEPRHLVALENALFTHAEDGKTRTVGLAQFLDLICYLRPEITASVLDVADLRKQIRAMSLSSEKMAAWVTTQLEDCVADSRLQSSGPM
mmetsp:Transcript_15845/g.35261  ORF Transcript_15845/g.35261 Transcript_15845/m.35261 type:complete len:433 (+) Transcript_15845:367-1665(+)